MIYDTKTIQQVNESVNIVEYAKRYLDLNYKNGEWWTKCCFHKNDETPSLSFNEDKNVFSCFACGVSGTPIVFVQNYHDLSFPKAIEHLISYTNLTLEECEYSPILEFLNKSNRKHKNKQPIERVYLPEDTINKYSKEPIKEWIKEGIQQEIMDYYDVRYDKNGNRIVFPIRDIDGNIICIKGRTLYPNYKDLGMSKYIYYQKIISNDFLFGLHKNFSNIKKKREVIVFEGCKAVMLAEGYGYDNVVSLETDSINEYQMRILLQLKVDVVLCLDKGIKITTKKVINNKNKDFTYINIGLLPKMTNVYVVEDKYNLLPDKASPVDLGKETWDKLYESRYKV